MNHGSMKKMLIRLVAALVLTLPVYIGLGHLGPLDRWFESGAAWDAFDPLFRLGEIVGVTDQASIVIHTMFVVSFIIACIVIGFASALVRTWSWRRLGNR